MLNKWVCRRFGGNRPRFTFAVQAGNSGVSGWGIHGKPRDPSGDARNARQNAEADGGAVRGWDYLV